MPPVAVDKQHHPHQHRVRLMAMSAAVCNHDVPAVLPGARHSNCAPARRAGSSPSVIHDPAFRQAQGRLLRAGAPLELTTGDPPSFPSDILPPKWRDWCRHAARAATAPADYVALSLLTVAAGLIGGARHVTPVPAWREPCVLWTALVGAPGSGRTRGLDAALQLVRALEQHLGSIGDAARRRHAGAREAARVHARLWRQDVRNLVLNGAAPDPLPPEAEDPLPPRRLVIDDPRIQPIADAARGHPSGILLAPDALEAWLAARRRAGLDGRCWLKAWSAQPWTVTRRGEPVGEVACAVSILGTLRPEAIPPERRGGSDDVLGRLLFICPPRAVLQPLLPDADGFRADVLEALARLRDMPPAARDVPLTPAALAVFEAFRRVHDQDAIALAGREVAWWSNGPAMVLRLAGVLCFLDWAAQATATPEPAQVSAEHIGAAVDLWRRYLWPQARAVFDAAGQRDVERVRRWLAAQRLDAVSREQIRREALSQAVTAAEADAVAEALVAAGWLRPMDPVATGPGRPPRRWQVNSALWAEDPCHATWEKGDAEISATSFDSNTRDDAKTKGGAATQPLIPSAARDPG
ncbi:DUF3987 domain-containing protein, partial [Vineibacter terrae]|uniref:DUF3987 domain-containing protein n=1 Tax=Vineibacter terrae TaxID=2586908 RepID=UPI002E376A56